MERTVTNLKLSKECFPRLAYAARNVPALKERCFKILEDFGEDTSEIEQSSNLQFVYVKLYNKISEEKALSVNDVVLRENKNVETRAILNQPRILKTTLEKSCPSECGSDISVVITSSKLKDEIDKLEDGFGNYFVHVASSEEEARTLTEEFEIRINRVEILFTTRSQLPQDLNNLLEKIAYAPLKPAYGRLQTILNRKGQHQLTKMEKEQIECLCEEILALYEMSELPDKERPRVNKKTGCSITKEVCEDIFTQCPSVEALSFHFNKLHVYIRDDIGTADNSEKEKINTVMNKHNVKEFCITIKEEFIDLMEIGSTIKAEPLRRIGSLGCYADMVGEQMSETCLLLSRHVADNCNHIYFVGNVKKKIATVIPETTRAEYGSLDIAAAVLEGNLKVGTDERKLKNSNGDKLEGRKTEGSNQILRKGRKVNIWGSKSRPGIGVIVDESYFIKGMKACLILIQDYCKSQTGECFAQEGDSGSIICTDDPNDKCVYALAMLMGCSQNEVDDNSNVKRMYLALPLEDGIKQLEMLTKRKFKVFA